MSICLCGRDQEASLSCGLCEGFFCKNCIEFLSPETFSFMNVIPKYLTLGQYCLPCFADKIRPKILNYHQTMKRAKGILFLDKPRRKPVKILKKLNEPLLVKDCKDREETILRLAFKAAELGFNSVVKANVNYKKVRNAGYQKMMWQGTGIAATLDESSE